MSKPAKCKNRLSAEIEKHLSAYYTVFFKSYKGDFIGIEKHLLKPITTADK
jgi:hypothetical protein